MPKKLIGVIATSGQQGPKGDKGDKGDPGTGHFTPGNAISIENEVIGVLTTNNAEEDNTRPITSAGVHTIVGNINTLLELI